jgi:hypothetical protein
MGYGQEIILYSTAFIPARLWGPQSLLPNGYQGLFLQVQSGQGVKLDIHLYLMPKLRTVELYLHSPTRHHAVVLN